jgi:hypothetical protein
MIDFIVYFIIAVSAFWLGKQFAIVRFIENLSNNPDKIIKMLEEIKRINAEHELAVAALVPEDAIMLNTEERAGSVYLFQSEDDKFIAQGKSIEDALKSAAERFPGKKFWIPTVKQDTQTA